MKVIKPKMFERMSDGPHDVTITAVVDLGVQGIGPNWKPCVDCAQIVFTSDDEKSRNGDAVEAVLTFEKTLHPRGRLHRLLRDLKSLPPAGLIDLRCLIGTKCPIVVDGKHTAVIPTNVPPRFVETPNPADDACILVYDHSLTMSMSEDDMFDDAFLQKIEPQERLLFRAAVLLERVNGKRRDAGLDPIVLMECADEGKQDAGSTAEKFAQASGRACRVTCQLLSDGSTVTERD